MDLSATTEALARHFLRPDRARLADLREQARRAESVEDLLEQLQHTTPRWVHLSPREAEQHGLSDDQLPILDRPPSLARAPLLLCDPDGMDAAEEAAHDFVRRLAAHGALPGGVPQRMVWRVSGWGCTPSGSHSRRLPPVERVLAPFLDPDLGGQPGAQLDDLSWTRPFARIAWLAAQQADWLAAMASGTASGPDPFEPLIRLWSSGYGLWSVEPDRVVLLLPESGDAQILWARCPLPVTSKIRLTRTRQLADACHRGDAPQWLLQLVEDGADPGLLLPGNLRMGGLTALHALAISPVSVGMVERVRALLSVGADPGRRDRRGRNVLLAVLKGPHPEHHEALIEAGISLEVRDVAGQTALHQAVVAQDHAAVLQLLELGASPDARDEAGRSPLLRAIELGQGPTIEALLSAGADPHQRTRDGATAYHLLATNPRLSHEQQWIERFATAGVAHTPDRHGWHADQLSSLSFPPRQAAELPPMEPWPRPPRALVSELGDHPEAWAVLADWLMQHRDVRGQLLARSRAGRGRAHEDAVAEQLERYRHLLIEPFVAAHPLGRRMALSTGCSLTFVGGILRRLALDVDRYAPAMPALLGSAAADLIAALRLRMSQTRSLSELLPRGLPIGELQIDARQADAPLQITTEALPALRSLILRIPVQARVVLSHGSLQRLAIGRCGLAPAARRRAHADEAPLPPLEETLEEVVFATPPAALEALELCPVGPELLRRLCASALLPRLRSLVLYAQVGHAALIEQLEVQHQALAHLDSLELRIRQLPRIRQRELEARLGDRLPALGVKGYSLFEGLAC